MSKTWHGGANLKKTWHSSVRKTWGDGVKTGCDGVIRKAGREHGAVA